MSRRFVVVAEDRLGFTLTTALCDRVVAERSGWLRDHWSDETSRRSFRAWEKLDASTPAAWTTRADVRRLWGKRPLHPLRLKAEGALAYKAAKLALERSAEGTPVDALFVVHDSDGDEATESNMRRGAREATAASPELVVVVATPHPEVEAWVVAGIVAETDEEEASHDSERQRLGFDPVREPHRLSSGKRTGKRDAKGVCEAILGEEHAAPDRWARCWERTPLTTLEENGDGAGLRAYVGAVEKRVLPVLGDRAPQDKAARR
jgi:hypothetical protein